MNKVELLAPVGDWDCLKAAVQNGADSVYFGIDKFNARMYAQNFNLANLKEAVLYCKLRNVKVNITLNTLIKNREFGLALDIAKVAYECGVDALIVQDLGLAKYLISHLPEIPIHASTQMTTHNLEGVLELEKLGFQRIVLARELSIDEIEHICSNSQVEIETFVHGALCICYSGQCLFSSVVGGRSGNRGKCAGPCRLPYELISKDNATSEVNSLEKGYLLSTKDICGIAFLPRLIKAGVKCFKIEGRMKNPEYVATVTRIYRKYIDMVLNEQEFIIDEKDVNDLMQVFNRGAFSSGHLDSKPNNNLVFAESPRNLGMFLGTIKSYNKNKGHITLKLQYPIELGDYISVQNEEGKYYVSELMCKDKNIKNAEINTEVTIGRMKGNIKIGDKVYKVVSKSLFDSAHLSYENVENKKVALNCNVTIKKEVPIKIQLYTKNTKSIPEIYRNINVEVVSTTIPVDALKTPISVERVIKQISKTNNTPYYFEDITVFLDDGLYVPSISALNELRRAAIEKLEKEIENRMINTCPSISENIIDTISYISPQEHPNVSLHLRELFLDYDYTKLEKTKINKIYIPLKYLVDKKYFNIISCLSENYNLYIYLPVIIKGNYKNIILNSLDDITRKFNIKGFVLSNLSDFEFLEKYKDKYEFIGNYSLNVFNNNTLKEYSKLGLNCVTLSRELSKENLNEIIKNSGVDIELVVYGNLPIMVTNYCLLGKTNQCYPDCRTNCTNNKTYYLKDRLGFEFRIIPDNMQTTTLICNSKTLSISTHDIPVNFVRVDIIDESIDEINNIVEHTFNRDRLEGIQYTNGNLNRDV